MYYKKGNILNINHELWFRSTINGGLLKPPSFEDYTYTYNYEMKDTNAHLEEKYYCLVSSDKPITSADYNNFTKYNNNPQVILDGNINTNLHLEGFNLPAAVTGGVWPEIHNVTIDLTKPVNVNSFQVYYKWSGAEWKPYQIQLKYGNNSVSDKYDLNHTNLDWHSFNLGDGVDVKKINKIVIAENVGPITVNSAVRCHIYAIKINGNILTNRNSWLLSWADLSSTQNDGNSIFLVGDNKDAKLATSESILGLKLANIQNYPDGIKINTTGKYNT